MNRISSGIVALILCFATEVNASALFKRKINRWKNNRYEGLWITWSDSLKKTVESKGRYKNGHECGVWRYYYEDGTLRRRERYSKSGISTKYYYSNGKIKSRGMAIVENEGEFLHYYYHGDWIYFNEQGKPEQVITYEKGVEISSEETGKSKRE